MAPTTMDQINAIREEFPITREEFTAPDGTRRRIIYMDHGASTHPPRLLLDYYRDFLERYYANIHRGNHYLSQRASDLFDNVTNTILSFLGAERAGNEVIFTVNTTSAIDIASHLMKEKEGVTLVTGMEHHSNDLPHRRNGGTVRAGLLEDGTIDYADLETKLRDNKVKLVAMTGASNVTGYTPDIHRVARLAHQHGAKILVDGAQLLAHKSVDLRPNDADDHIDMFAAAGHKAYAPFGSAFLIAPSDICNESVSYIPGGGTVKFVTGEDTVWADGHERIVGGTPNIAGVIALGRVLEWLDSIGMGWIRDHEIELLEYALDGLKKIDGVVLLGEIPSEQRLGVIAFNIDGYHHEQVSQLLNDRFGIATRNGCFCAHPYLTHLLSCANSDSIRQRVEDGDESLVLPGAVRATIGIFNDRSDIEALLSAVSVLAQEASSGDRPHFDVTNQCADPTQTERTAAA